MSNIPGRLNKAEEQVEALALGYLSKRFNLGVEELEAAQKLKDVLSKRQFPDSLHDALLLFAKELETITVEQQKLRSLQIEAGIDADRLAEISHEMVLAFEPDEPVTIETLLELDRQIYERALLPVETSN